MAKILVIDDDSAFREGLLETLADLEVEAVGVGGVSDAVEILERRRFDAIFIDFRMPEMNGLDAIKLLQEKFHGSVPPIVMITAFVDSATTISAIRLGAFDHLTKPIGRADVERVLVSLKKSFPVETRTEPDRLDPKPSPRSADELIGSSDELREVLKMIGRVAATDSSVLITGETGTGKELVAKAIHRNSDRAQFPFVAVNCAAIPESLLESELFGHVKGAFTGATSDRKGSFQMAEGGTLFLDEIGDMNYGLQAKLLRSLQEREVTPVGASQPVKVNLRFLAATHQGLKTLVEQKKFREDLYFRLNVVEIGLPRLKDRLEDLPILIEHFLRQQAALGGVPKRISADALQRLQHYPWPGNIRELKNVIERAVVIARGVVIGVDEIRFLNEGSAAVEDETLDLPQSVARLERRLIARALQTSAGNRSEAARLLGIQRQLLYTKLKDYQIDA